MFLPVIASLLYGAGYVVYMFQLSSGSSVPNPASWTVWAILSLLNAITFLKGSKSMLASMQFFTGAAANFAVWAYALVAGYFAPLETIDTAVLILCLLVPVVWKATGKATYGSVMMGIILTISFIPTISKVWEDPGVERALPWYLWTSAFVFTIANGVRRRKEEHEVDWRPMLFVPVVMFFAHGIVAILVPLQ